MADEAKDPGGISKDGTGPNAAGTPAQPLVAEPEVHILEEHVTHAAQKPAQTATPPQSLNIPEKTPAPSAPAPAPATPVAPKADTPLPPAPPASPPSQPPAQPDTTASDVGLVIQSRKVPGPKNPSMPPPVPAPERPSPAPAAQKPGAPRPDDPALGNDIAKILASVKLPERRDETLPGPKKTPDEPKKFDTSIAGSALSEEAASPSATVPPKEPKAGPADISSGGMPSFPGSGGTKVMEKNPSSVVAVHTLKDDLQGVVHDQKISVVRAVSLEEDRRARKGSAPGGETPGAQQRSSRTFGILFASLVLLALGVGALSGVLFIMNQQKAPPQIDTGDSILFAEQSVLLPLDGQSPAGLKGALEAGRATSQGALGSITRIVPVTAEAGPDGTPQNRPATFREFMAAIGAHPSDDLLRALGSDFFLGIHAVDKSAPLIIIPVVSHARAFEAMLSWEETLNSDVAPFFTAVPVLKLDANGVPSKRTYEDLVMRNYDVRALKDDAGTIQLYYSFPTQNVLIIAESPYSFPEILSRLQASRQL